MTQSRRAAMRVVHHVAEALRDGDMVAVIPEGTTGYGEELVCATAHQRHHHPWQEPYAVVPHVRICAGGGG